jgi:hypothetical protein
VVQLLRHTGSGGGRSGAPAASYAGGGIVVQRAGEKTASWEEAMAALDAIGAVLRNKGRFAPSALSEFEQVPDRYRDLVWEWFRITSRHVEIEGGATVSYRGRFRLEHIDLAMKDTAPLIAALRAEGDASTGPWLDTAIFNNVSDLRARGHEEEAEDLVEGKAADVGTVLGPQAKAEEDQLREGVKLAINVLGNIDSLVDISGDADKKIDAEITRQLAAHPLPPAAKAAKLASAMDAVGWLADVLGGVSAAVEIQDPEQRRAMVNRKLGAWGEVQAVAQVGNKLGSIFQGATTVLGVAAAATCTALGHVDKARTVLGAVSNLASYSGVVGKPMGVLTIVQGTIAVVHPESTPEERVSGAADISLGSAAVVGGAVGGGLLGAGLALKVDLALLELAAGAAEGLVWVELSQCYEEMKSHAELMAKHANEVMAAQALVAAETDPIRVAYLMKALSTKTYLLHRALSYFLDQTTNAPGRWKLGMPAYWKPLRTRFAKATPWPISDPSPTQLVNAARATLVMVERVFADRRQVLKEATWDRDH